VRYPVGTIQLNGEHDLPLLRQLAHTRFATRSQLVEFQGLRGSDECRRSLNWRIKRLIDHGFVDRRTVPALGAEYIYSLTTHGAVRLEGIEERFSLSLSAERSKAGDLSVIHSVELNSIQLRAARAGLLVRWIPEAEIRSENELAGLSYKKEYDAVVTLQFGGRDITFALEYERTSKSRERYDKIAASVCAEQEVDQFLYLTANEHLLRFVSWSFRDVKRCVMFGLAADWHRQMLDMPAFSWKARRYVPLKTLFGF
jgi:hypothetical protein